MLIGISASITQAENIQLLLKLTRVVRRLVEAEGDDIDKHIRWPQCSHVSLSLLENLLFKWLSTWFCSTHIQEADGPIFWRLCTVMLNGTRGGLKPYFSWGERRGKAAGWLQAVAELTTDTPVTRVRGGANVRANARWCIASLFLNTLNNWTVVGRPIISISFTLWWFTSPLPHQDPTVITTFHFNHHYWISIVVNQFFFLLIGFWHIKLQKGEQYNPCFCVVTHKGWFFSLAIFPNNYRHLDRSEKCSQERVEETFWLLGK